MTEYIAQAVSKFNGKEYFVSVSGKNKDAALRELGKESNFRFFIFTKSEFYRHIYSEIFMFEKYDEDGSLNEHRYIDWKDLPARIKDYYKLKAMKEVISPDQLEWLV